MTRMQRPKNWAFFTKDLDRTDQRREWRYHRNHVSTERGIFAADQSQNPASQAACDEFLESYEPLVEKYQHARGRRKQRLREKLLRKLHGAGFIGSRESRAWSDFGPRDWSRLRTAD